MTEKSINETFSQIREIPESMEYEDVAKMVLAVPVAAATTFGFLKVLLKFFQFKYFIPMFFTTTSASLAVWYAVQTFNPASPEAISGARKTDQSKPVVIQMNKDLPLTIASIPADTQKKKIIKKKEVRVIRKGNPGEMEPMEPIPPMPPLPPGAKGKQVIEKQERIIQHSSEGELTEKEKDPMSDPFISTLLDYLSKEGLIKDKESFTIDLSPTELEVNSVNASKEQLKKAIQIFEDKEGEKFGKGSEIEISHKKGQWSISKSIEN